MEKPGRLQSIGSQRFEHDWATNTFTFHMQNLRLHPRFMELESAHNLQIMSFVSITKFEKQWLIPQKQCRWTHSDCTRYSPSCCCCSALSNSWEPIECNPSGSSVQGISQARILEWVAISFSNSASTQLSTVLCGQVTTLHMTAITTTRKPWSRPLVSSVSGWTTYRDGECLRGIRQPKKETWHTRRLEVLGIRPTSTSAALGSMWSPWRQPDVLPAASPGLPQSCLPTPSSSNEHRADSNSSAFERALTLPLPAVQPSANFFKALVPHKWQPTPVLLSGKSHGPMEEPGGL